MTASTSLLARVYGALHRRFLWLLVGAYVLAVVWSAGGHWFHRATLGQASLFGHPLRIDLSSLLLAALLFVAGTGLQVERLLGLVRNPLPLGLGLLGNLGVPLLFVLVLAAAARGCGLGVQSQALVAGLALIASVPVAASSAVWSHRAEGDLALSLGLVALSTCLSPLATPAVLALLGCVAAGDAVEGVRQLSGWQTGLFLAVFVMLPTLAGVAVRLLLGAGRVGRLKPGTGLLSLAALLLLNYGNTAAALPHLHGQAGWVFLTVTLAAVAALCALNFTAGWALARLSGADRGTERSLIFGLGMNAGGPGLVIASTALAHLPGAVLPVILYTLAQHLAAGAVDRWLQRHAPEPGPDLAPGTGRRRRRAACPTLVRGRLCADTVIRGPRAPRQATLLGPLW
jgi:BASS family bile acid:Na+ symporter